MKSNQRIILTCIVAGVVIAGFLLWFNRYAFSEMKIGNDTFPVRTSRFTGDSEVFVMGHWTQMGGVSSSSTSSDKSFVIERDS
jgi:hypothetical protein